MIDEDEITAPVVGEQEIKTESKGYPLMAKRLFEIVDDAGMNAAGEFLVKINGFRKRAEEFFKPMKVKLDVLKKEILDREREVITPLREAEIVVKGGMAIYELRREQERRAEEERQRKEAQARADQAKLDAAVEAEKNGDGEAAEAILNAPVVIPPQTIPRPANPAGVSFREDWKAEVTDLMVLVKAVAAGTAPITLLEPAQTAINGMARSLKSAMKVPGIRTWAEKIVAARAR